MEVRHSTTTNGKAAGRGRGTAGSTATTHGDSASAGRGSPSAVPGGRGYYDAYGYDVPYYGYDVTPYASEYTPDTVVTPVEPNVDGAADNYAQALTAFRQGDFRAAILFASHAAIDNPRDRNVHLLLSLAMFAAGDYRGSAMEAHAVVAIGPLPDQPTLLGIYGNAQAHADQMRALQKFVEEHPAPPEGHFLLGFHYAMEGRRDLAQAALLKALTAAPRDKVAAMFLTQEGGTVPPAIAKQLGPVSTP